jgi:hypothetical protein
MRRTLDNCKLVKRYGRPLQYDGKCEGFAKSCDDDEPCEVCMGCPLNTAYEKEDSHE